MVRVLAQSSIGPETMDMVGGALWSAAASPSGLPILLATARLLGLLLVTPLFSSRLLPVRLRMGIAVVLAIAIAPVAESAAGVDRSALAGAIAGEVLLGVATGWAAFLVFAAIRAAATCISEQAGFAFGGVVDPASGAGAPVLRTLYGGLALFVFLAADLHHEFLRAAASGMRVVPPGSIGEAGLLAGLERLAMSAGAFLFEAALLVALPVLAVLLLAAVAQGVLARLFPELETVFFGFLVRTALAVGVIALTLPALAETSRRLFEGAAREGAVLLSEMAR